MSVQCEKLLDELTVQVWFLYDQQNLKYCTLYVSGTELRTDKRTNRQTDDQITRCPRRVSGRGIKIEERKILTNNFKNSGSIRRNACVACETAMRDYKEIVNTGQTDRKTHRYRTKWSLKSRICRRSKKGWNRKVYSTSRKHWYKQIKNKVNTNHGFKKKSASIMQILSSGI